jgi:hypothetical protein
MTHKVKGPSRIKPLPNSRRIAELAADDYVDRATRTEINRGKEHQARDGSNLRTMAEAEREEGAP